MLGPVSWWQSGTIQFKVFGVEIPYSLFSKLRAEYVHLQTDEERENFMGYAYAEVHNGATVDSTL